MSAETVSAARSSARSVCGGSMSSNAIPDISTPEYEASSPRGTEGASCCVHDTLPPADGLEATAEFELHELFETGARLEPHDTIPAPPWHVDASDGVETSPAT